MLPIVLASASPRRKELLEQIGLDFIVFPADVDERLRWESPIQGVQELACRKARSVVHQFQKNVWILGADTVVVHRGKVMGKPADRREALAMLSRLQGDTHSVYTGVCAIKKEEKNIQESSFVEETKVSIYPMEMWEMEEYTDTLEPMDKAGAYGIQGGFAKYVRCIQGDYNNVVGLPISRIYQEVLKFM